MSANSEWLKAYEAQKSKALEQLSAAKSDAGLIHSNASGLSGPSKKRRVFNSWAYASPSANASLFKTPVVSAKNTTSSSQFHGNGYLLIILKMNYLSIFISCTSFSSYEQPI